MENFPGIELAAEFLRHWKRAQKEEECKRLTCPGEWELSSLIAPPFHESWLLAGRRMLASQGLLGPLDS